MSRQKKSYKNLIFSVGAIIILGGLFLINPEVRAWSEPTAAPPGGNVAAPINVSSTSQIKLGPLTLGQDAANYGVLKLVPRTGAALTTCTAAEEGQLFYQAGAGFYYCNGSEWRSFTGSGFQLGTEAQTGWGYLQGVTGKEFALKGVSSDSGDLLYYTGVEGAAGKDEPKFYGVYGTDAGFPDAYAGYFQGNVSIRKNAAGGNTKLEVGEAGGATKEVSLCLNDNCITNWPAGGGSFWTQVGLDTYLTRTDKNLAVGGADENSAGFYVNVDSEGSALIGQPEDLLQAPIVANAAFYCGDWVCRQAVPIEVNIASSPVNPDEYVCPRDCPPKFTVGPNKVKLSGKMGISWTTDEKNWGRVYYATEADYSVNQQYNQSKAALFSGTSENNGLELIVGTDIEAGVLYHYQVKVWDEYNNSNYSYDSTFTY